MHIHFVKSFDSQYKNIDLISPNYKSVFLYTMRWTFFNLLLSTPGMNRDISKAISVSLDGGRAPSTSVLSSVLFRGLEHCGVGRMNPPPSHRHFWKNKTFLGFRCWFDIRRGLLLLGGLLGTWFLAAPTPWSVDSGTRSTTCSESPFSASGI